MTARQVTRGVALLFLLSSIAGRSPADAMEGTSNASYGDATSWKGNYTITWTGAYGAGFSGSWHATYSH